MDLLGVRQVQRGDGRALVRKQRHQTLGGEVAERLPHRCHAHAEILGQTGLDERGAGAQLAGEDSAAQRLVRVGMGGSRCCDSHGPLISSQAPGLPPGARGDLRFSPFYRIQHRAPTSGRLRRGTRRRPLDDRAGRNVAGLVQPATARCRCSASGTTRTGPDGSTRRPTTAALPLGAQRPAQQQITMRLVAEGLSGAAYNTVAAVIGIENVLDRVEGFSGTGAGSEAATLGLYWLRFFGGPGATAVGMALRGPPRLAELRDRSVVGWFRPRPASSVRIRRGPRCSAAASSPRCGRWRTRPGRLSAALTEAQLRQALLHPIGAERHHQRQPRPGWPCRPR